jgi:hypothetical protein
MNTNTHSLRALIKEEGLKKTSAAYVYLRNGGEFSGPEAKRAGIKNPSALVHHLRNNWGVEVYTNRRRDGAGNRISRYRAA